MERNCIFRSRQRGQNRAALCLLLLLRRVLTQHHRGEDARCHIVGPSFVAGVNLGPGCWPGPSPSARHESHRVGDRVSEHVPITSTNRGPTQKVCLQGNVSGQKDQKANVCGSPQGSPQRRPVSQRGSGAFLTPAALCPQPGRQVPESAGLPESA